MQKNSKVEELYLMERTPELQKNSKVEEYGLMFSHHTVPVNTPTVEDQTAYRVGEKESHKTKQPT